MTDPDPGPALGWKPAGNVTRINSWTICSATARDRWSRG